MVYQIHLPRPTDTNRRRPIPTPSHTTPTDPYMPTTQHPKYTGTTTPGGGQQEAAMSVDEAEAMHKARHVILGHSDSALALAVSGRRLFR